MYKYKVELVKRMPPPEGSPKKLWYRYIISNQVNTINGCRAGNYHSVFEFVSECINNLNQNYIPNGDDKVFSPVHESCRMIEAEHFRTDW